MFGGLWRISGNFVGIIKAFTLGTQLHQKVNVLELEAIY